MSSLALIFLVSVSTCFITSLAYRLPANESSSSEKLIHVLAKLLEKTQTNLAVGKTHNMDFEASKNPLSTPSKKVSKINPFTPQENALENESASHDIAADHLDQSKLRNITKYGTQLLMDDGDDSYDSNVEKQYPWRDLETYYDEYDVNRKQNIAETHPHFPWQTRFDKSKYPLNNTKPIRPVVMMHGLVSDCSTLSYINASILKYYPNVNITMIDEYTYEMSIVDCPRQTKYLIEYMREISEKHSDGITLICYSQGSILCRGIIEEMDDHSIHTFISIAGPLAGQYGVTSFLEFWLPVKTRKDVHSYLYTWWGQHYSIAGYWKDPFHLKEYLKKSTYLPYLDNHVSHPDVERYKKNFLKLKRMVLIGGPNDGVIEPWQSSFFGYFVDNSSSDVDHYSQRDVYLKDNFGLRTLDERGGLKLHMYPHVGHLEFHHDPKKNGGVGRSLRRDSRNPRSYVI